MSTRINFTIKQTDGEWQKIKARLKPLTKDPRAKVGIVGAQASQTKGKLSLPEVAAVHEFGSPKNRIPERSFIRSTLDANKADYINLIRPLLVLLLEGKLTVKRLLGLWGAKAASDVKGRLLRGTPIPPPLSKQTVKERLARAKAQQQQGTKPSKLRDSSGRFLSLKGTGMRPLVDTGQLVAAISWEVAMEGTEAPQP